MGYDCCKDCERRFPPYRDEATGKMITCRQDCKEWEEAEEAKMERYERTRLAVVGAVNVSPTHERQYRKKQRRAQMGRK